jgi:hypothetical protein
MEQSVVDVLSTFIVSEMDRSLSEYESLPPPAFRHAMFLQPELLSDASAIQIPPRAAAVTGTDSRVMNKLRGPESKALPTIPGSVTAVAWPGVGSAGFTFPEVSEDPRFRVQSVVSKPSFSICLGGGGMRAATLALGWIRAVHQVLPHEYESQVDLTLGRVRERKTA